jgi:polar amino acid transport system substrate-binding protein
MTVVPRISMLVLVVAICAVFTNAVGAEKDEDQPLTIVIDRTDFYPFYYRENAKLVGPLPEVTSAVLSAIGYMAEFREVPWSRAVDLVTRRQVDAVAGIFYRPEREFFLHYPRSFPAESRLNLFVPISSELAFDGDLSVLENEDIGTVLGWSYKLFTQSQKIGRIDFADEKILVRNVALGRIGIGIGNPTSLAKFAREQGLENHIRVIAPPVERTPLFTAFSKKPGHEDLARRFSTALEAFKETPAFREIMKRHGLK